MIDVYMNKVAIGTRCACLFRLLEWCGGGGGGGVSVLPPFGHGSKTKTGERRSKLGRGKARLEKRTCKRIVAGRV